MILLWADNQDPPCHSIVHFIFRYHQSKLPFVSAFVFCDPTPDCIVMKKQCGSFCFGSMSWNQVSVSREASSLFPSWGRASCVAQRWPLSSQRESAYWRSRGQVSLWFWLNGESQLQRTSRLSLISACSLCGKTDLWIQPLDRTSRGWKRRMCVPPDL